MASALGMKEFYGCNLDALLDVLSTGVERPVTLIWKNSHASKAAMGVPFERIREILERVKLQDEEFGWDDKFTYQLC
ncbi:barstar family protein [Paraburkholderia fungorum]|uniref:barstar family protein n=1 Tax=Paraburkholderia fungorum TaxID=134537 RepID=UPI0025B74DB1|nr:barstar family protein [Paraburkholderia fungorum]